VRQYGDTAVVTSRTQTKIAFGGFRRKCGAATRTCTSGRKASGVSLARRGRRRSRLYCPPNS
jgi:hypothetical protein